MILEKEWTRRDSNPRPHPCKGRALPTELQALTTLNVFNFLYSLIIISVLFLLKK